MSPRAIKKKVNTFIEEKVLTSQHATAVMFEELCKSSLESIDTFFDYFSRQYK